MPMSLCVGMRPPAQSHSGQASGKGCVGLVDLVPPVASHIGTKSLTRMMAPGMAVATSLEHLTPRPTYLL